ncbi:MAG: SpoIIE family protein phosphatase [Oscillospiraceae bacterium]|nr:SpoIIE family protein phosphatase [Oscillospiraceae bacterium]
MKRRARYRRWGPCLALLLLLTIVLSTGAAAAVGSSEAVKIVDPINEPDNYSAVLYDNTNGLPTAEANAIVQTSEGFIWIGSYAGLIRYDGNTFERMDSTYGIASVVSLLVDSRDRLWIGTNDSGVAVMEQGEYRMWGKAEGLPSAKICAIAEDQNGTIYLATSSGIATIDPDCQVHTMDEPELAKAEMRDIRLGSDGIIYGTTDLGDLIMIKDGRLLRFISVEDSPLDGAGAMLPDPDAPGCIYQEAADFALYHVDLNDGFKILKKYNIEPLKYLRDIECCGGRLWICGGNGIGVLDGNNFHLLEDQPMNNNVGHVMTDYLGNLWFTSTRQGVMKVVSNQFSNLSERYGLNEMVVNSTCMHDGKLFVGTDTGLIALDDNGMVSSIPLTKASTASGKDLGADDLISMLDGFRIRSIIRDSRNRLWFSTWRGEGLLCYDRGEVTAFSMDDGMLSNNFRAVCEREDGSILVALSGGVNVIRDGRVVAGFDKDDGIVVAETLTVAEGTDGDIVVGSNGGGIYIFNENGLVKTVNVEDGLPSGIVMRLKRDAKRDVIWIVTSNAIAYMTPDYQVTKVQQFPYSNNFDLYENSKGDMWVLSSNGIYVTPAEELIANGDITPVYYSIANGLSCIATANSYSELTGDGNLYIAGTTGVCEVNIDRPFENVEDMKATVPFVEVDGQTLYPDANGTFTIPSDTQKLTVYSFVYNYSLSDPQVSYRLEGFERSDTTVRRSDMVPVDYTNLRGGNYRFVMQLKDAMGRGNKEVSVQIVKEKAFYEQAWFYVIVALAVIAVIALLVRAYVRRRMNALEARHREEAERERIENELKMANRIQTDALPPAAPEFPDHPNINLRGSMHTAKEVGGDFYDYFPIDDDRICFLIADVSGKSTPAALFMMTSKTMIKDYALNKGSTSEIFTAVNARLCENNEANMFATAWIGILDTKTMTLQYTNAGHNYPYLQRCGQPCEEMKIKHGLFLGGMEYTRYKQSEITLSPGDRLLLYTDGVVEAHDRNDDLYGMERLEKVLDSTRDCPGELVLERIFNDVCEYATGVPQFDDITMVVLTVK